MDKTPLVTVGIPVYNGDRYIKQAVMSVLNQTFRDLELIVTDDGSKDDTLNILKDIKDPRLKIVTDGTNHGIAYKLNQQIDMARGKYFFRMDADDMMFPYRLEKQVEVLNSKPEVDVVGGQAVIIGEEDEILGKRGVEASDFKGDNDFFLSARFIHPTVAGRIEWFKKWRYRDEMSGNEDLDLWIRSHNDSVFFDIEEPLLFYRDPYRFRLKTYMFRQRRYWKCTWKLREFMSTPLFYSVCMIRGLLSMTFAIFLALIGQEEQMIAKRNKRLNDNEIGYYNKIIEKI